MAMHLPIKYRARKLKFLSYFRQVSGVPKCAGEVLSPLFLDSADHIDRNRFLHLMLANDRPPEAS
jgi:hypothetical protein